MTWHGIEPRSPGPLANTLTTRPVYIYIFINTIIIIKCSLSLSLPVPIIQSPHRVLPGWPKLARQCVGGVYKNVVTHKLILTSLKYQACLVRLTWIIYQMGGKWPYCCFFSMSFTRVHVVHPHSITDTATACMKACFVLLERSDFRMIDNLSIAIYNFCMCMLTSLSVDGILLPRYAKLSSNFSVQPFNVVMAPFHLKLTWSVLFLLA